MFNVIYITHGVGVRGVGMSGAQADSERGILLNKKRGFVGDVSARTHFFVQIQEALLVMVFLLVFPCRRHRSLI